MSAQTLIRQAQESGVTLTLVDGKVKAKGPREAVTRMLVPLREHRMELANALLADQDPVPADWHALDRAYQVHHFKCHICIAAGRGSRYGLRCGAGAALWRAYSATRP